jgi:hypothetical protein
MTKDQWNAAKARLHVLRQQGDIENVGDLGDKGSLHLYGWFTMDELRRLIQAVEGPPLATFFCNAPEESLQQTRMRADKTLNTHEGKPLEGLTR